jgi:hypothetical protein
MYIIKEIYFNKKNKISIYYIFSNKWTMIQKEATRFESREDALGVCHSLNRQGSNARIVKLKKKNYCSKKIQEPFDAQTFLAKIDQCFLEDKAIGITINSDNYQELFMKNMCKIHNRYEPATHIDLLREGIVGYLTVPYGAKPIKISRYVESGKILVSKESK